MGQSTFTLASTARTTPYKHIMAEIAGNALPKEWDQYFKENIDHGKFKELMGSFIAESVTLPEFEANGKRLKEEFSRLGGIKDITSGKILSVAESLQLLRVYGYVSATSDACEHIAFSEGINPDDIKLKALEENLKRETEELNGKIGKASVDEIRKKTDELIAIRDEIRNLKDAKNSILEGYIRKALDIWYQCIRIWQIADLTTKIVGGTVIATLATDPFTKAYFSHPLVIAAIIVDIIWIIGPKNIPILREIWEFQEDILAKLGVGIANLVKSGIDAVKEGLDKVLGKKRTFGESIQSKLMDADEMHARIAKANTVPETIKEIVGDSKDIKDFSNAVFKSVVVDLKKDSIESDKVKKEEEEEVTKIKQSITDTILQNTLGSNPTIVDDLAGKLGSEEVAALPMGDSSTDDNADTKTEDINVEDNGDSTDDSDNLEDDNEDSGKTGKNMTQVQESIFFKRRQEFFLNSQGIRFKGKTISYIDTIKDCSRAAAIDSIIRETEE